MMYINIRAAVILCDKSMAFDYKNGEDDSNTRASYLPTFIKPFNDASLGSHIDMQARAEVVVEDDSVLASKVLLPAIYSQKPTRV